MGTACPAVLEGTRAEDAEAGEAVQIHAASCSALWHAVAVSLALALVPVQPYLCELTGRQRRREMMGK